MAYALLTSQPIRLQDIVERIRAPRNGAYVTFTGDVRDHDQGKRVTRLHYTAYEELARKQLGWIAAQAEERWPGVSCAVAHRIGILEIGDCSVAVVAAAAHRGDAFDACRWIIDTVKTEVPIWKREEYEEGGSVWIEGSEAVPALSSPAVE